MTAYNYTLLTIKEIPTSHPLYFKKYDDAMKMVYSFIRSYLLNKAKWHRMTVNEVIKKFNITIDKNLSYEGGRIIMDKVDGMNMRSWYTIKKRRVDIYE